MEEIKEIKKLLTFGVKDIVILSHRNPDGDAVGSSLALYHFLKKFKHSIKIVVPSEYPGTFEYLPSIAEVEIFDVSTEECKEIVQRASIIFCLDFNALDRIDKLGDLVAESKAPVVLIDHHLDPEPFADHVISDPESSSTAELVYKFIVDLGYEKYLDKTIGTCIFTGLITDTGSFRYATRPYTYEVAANLKAIGVDDYSIQNNIFNSLKEKNLRLLGHCLANRMEVIPEYSTALIYLTKQDYIDFTIGRGDTEGIVNYMLMMKQIKMAAFITEQPNIIKLSLRSKGDINVQEIANQHFKGGGHKNASGGSAYAKLEDVINKFKRVLPKHIKNTNTI